MTQAVLGRPVGEAESLFRAVHDVLVDGVEAVEARLGKLSVLAGVKEFPMRVKCATLAWHTLHAALANEETTVTTE